MTDIVCRILFVAALAAFAPFETRAAARGIQTWH